MLWAELMAALRTLFFWIFALGTIASLASWLPSDAQADALRQIERETKPDSSRGERSRSSSRSVRTYSSGSSRSCVAGADCSGDMRGFLQVMFLPWSMPHMLMEDSGVAERDTLHRCLTTYAAHPYRGGSGILRDACDADEEHETRTLFGLSAESGYFMQEVVPASFGVRMLLPARLELSTRLDWLHDVAPHAQDRAWMSTTAFNIRFAQSQRAQLRVGVGPRYFRLDEPRWGLDLLLYGMDLYGRRPVVFRGEVHAGILGGAVLVQARATLGGMIGKAELYAGYDHTLLSDGEGSGVKLGGPVAGVRAWF